MTTPPRDRRTEPVRERAYVCLYARINGLEDTIAHLYDLIKEIHNRVVKLHDRVSLLEKKSKPEGEHTNLNQPRGS